VNNSRRWENIIKLISVVGITTRLLPERQNNLGSISGQGKRNLSLKRPDRL
jgi:hypothetical protein